MEQTWLGDIVRLLLSHLSTPLYSLGLYDKRSCLSILSFLLGSYLFVSKKWAVTLLLAQETQKHRNTYIDQYLYYPCETMISVRASNRKLHQAISAVNRLLQAKFSPSNPAPNSEHLDTKAHLHAHTSTAANHTASSNTP